MTKLVSDKELDECIDVLVLELGGKSFTHTENILRKCAYEGGDEARTAIRLLALLSQA